MADDCHQSLVTGHESSGIALHEVYLQLHTDFPADADRQTSTVARSCYGRMPLSKRNWVLSLKFSRKGTPQFREHHVRNEDSDTVELPPKCETSRLVKIAFDPFFFGAKSFFEKFFLFAHHLIS